METTMIAGTIAVLLFIVMILWQVILLMQQRNKYKEFETNYTEFKFTIEGTLKKEVDEIIKQNRALVSTINKLIEQRLS